MTPVSAMPIAATQFATVPPARLSLREAAVSNVPALVSRSWSALTAAASWTAVLARPTSRVAATGVGYAGPAGAETRRGTDGRDVPSGTAAGKRFIGTNGNGKQQDQLHLMSRRDPRSWRPPA